MSVMSIDIAVRISKDVLRYSCSELQRARDSLQDYMWSEIYIDEDFYWVNGAMKSLEDEMRRREWIWK